MGWAALEALHSLAAVTSLVVAIDDVQWLDPASTRTLSFAIRRLQAVPVGVLVTRRGTGEPLPLGQDRRRPASAGALTPTERRVAELVAEGRTNREVAGLLFLSSKTVAAHLTSTYAKLGVRSRTELAHRLRETAVPNARH